MISSFSSFGNNINYKIKSTIITENIVVSTPTFNYSTSGNLFFAYSLRVIVPGYSGPVVQIRRSTDNITSDFYTDFRQTFFTNAAPTGNTINGTSYSTWIGGGIGYITKWYDQTGNVNHATNANNASQPNIYILPNNYYTVQWRNTNSTYMSITTTRNINTVFCKFYNNNSAYGSIIAVGITGDKQLRFGSASANTYNGDSNGSDWFYSSGGTKVAYNNGTNQTSNPACILVASTTYDNTKWNTLSLSTSSPINFNFTAIGTDGYSNVRSINGYMFEILCHNKSMAAADMTDYYNNRLF